MPKFVATSEIKHDGKQIKKDGMIECSASEGKSLIAAGVARAVKDKKADK